MICLCVCAACFACLVCGGFFLYLRVWGCARNGALFPLSKTPCAMLIESEKMASYGLVGILHRFMQRSQVVRSSSDFPSVYWLFVLKHPLNSVLELELFTRNLCSSCLF